MPYLLGIDIGTSSAKAVLYESETAQVIAVAGREYPVHRPAPDRAEQDPLDWWNAAVDVARQVTAEHKDIAGISLSGQMHGGVPLGSNGEIVHPAIIWADSRTAQQVKTVLERVGSERYPQITGTLPAVGFLVVTLMWLQDHLPDVLAQTHHVLMPKDYVHYRLTGNMTTDPSDAAATGLFDVANGVWSAEVIDAIGVPGGVLPEVTPSANPTPLTAQAAQALGLAAGIPVVAGCADQPAQALGNGIIAPGTVSVTVGSGGQVFAPLAEIRTDPRLHVFNHAVPGMYYALGATLSAGLSLRWLRDVLNMADSENGYAKLSEQAAETSPGADGLLFLPYLSGERTPHMDPHARGAFIGLSSYHTTGHMARAVMEGVAYSMRQALEITQGLGGDVETVIGSGGAVGSPVWRRILTNVLNVPIRRSLVQEQAGVGAAVLAGVGVGVYDSFADASGRVAQHDDPTIPDAAHRALYDTRYEQFKALYHTLQADFHRLAGA